MSPGPYSDAAYTALAGALEFVTTATLTTAAGVHIADLEVLGGSCTFDEEWSPYVQAQLTVVDAGVLIDPRAAHRVVISTGYVYPTGVRDVQVLADLTVTAAERDHRQMKWSLTAQSDEALVLQSAYWPLVDLVVTYGNFEAALYNFLVRALDPQVPTAVTTITGSTAVLTNYTVKIGEAWWPHIETVRDIAGGIVYCDEARVWHLEDYVPDDSPQTDGAPATGAAPATFAPDANALRIITDSTVRLGRDEWANTVVIEHNFDDAGTPTRIAQTAYVSTGPYAVGTVGYRVYSEKRTTPVANWGEVAAECASLLYRTQRRGERRTIEARAAYWFRPRQLRQMWVNGTEFYARVTRVAFTLDGTGLMTLNTRTPEPDGAEG